MASVNVRLPNGRRQNVKVTPSTAIIQILDEVCAKWKLDSESYDLMFHNKVLDSSVIFRFSGVPNNACLEMTTCTKPRVVSDVTVRLLLENQDSKVGVFPPNTTLKEILHKLAPDTLNDLDRTIMLYAQKTFSGENDLQTTTLRALGIFKGQVSFRLRQCDPEQLNQQAHVYKPKTRVQTEEHSNYDSETNYTNNTGESTSTFESSGRNEDKFCRPINETKDLESEKAQKSDREKDVTSCEKSQNSSTNLISKTNFDPINFIRQEKKVNIEKKRAEKDDEEKEKNDLETEEQLVEESKMDNVQNSNTSESIPEPKLKERKISKEEKKEKEQIPVTKIYLGERNALVYDKANIKLIIREEAPDSFFNATLDDVRKMYNHYHKMVQTNEAMPLMTSSMRQQENYVAACTLLNTYPKSVIRICFPNQLILQGVFRSIETTQAIYNFVKSYLKNPDEQFYLYETPPRKNLDPVSRLYEQNLVPLANIYYSGSSELKDEIKSQLSDYEAAQLEVSNVLSKKVHQNDSESVENNTLESSSKIESRNDSDGKAIPGSSGTQIKSESNSLQSKASSSKTPVQKNNDGAKVPSWFTKGFKKF